MSEIKVNKVSPATGTAITLGDSGDTFTVPSGATIVNSGTATGFGGGKMLQVVSTTKTDTFTTSTTGSWVDITGLSVAVTPSASSSKILVLYSVLGELGSAAYSFGLRMVRGSTGINVGGAASSRTQASGAIDSYGGTGSISYRSHSDVFLDSPSTTSATTYKIQGLGSAAWYVNRNSTDGDASSAMRTTSSITVIEIGA